MLKISIFSVFLLYMNMFFSNNSMIMCLMLVMIALSLVIFLKFWVTQWISYTLVLIFLGGMMIIFIYMTSLIGGDKMNKFDFLSALLYIFLFFSFESNKEMSFILINKFSVMEEVYLEINSFNIMFLMFYLLFCLIVVVKNSEAFKGALMKLS